MSQIISVEQVYQYIAQEILEFIDGQPWDEAGAKYEIYSNMIGSSWWRKTNGSCIKNGASNISDETSRHVSVGLNFIRADLIKLTGERIWGLTFTLYPSGKFNIEYDYNKPEHYEETDETIDLAEAVKDLSSLGGSKPTS